MGIILIIVFAAGVAAGLAGSSLLGSLAVLLMQRDAQRRRYGWWVFGGMGLIFFLGSLRFARALPSGVNLPDALDLGTLFIYAAGYGLSVGVGAALGALLTLLIPRPARETTGVPPPLPRS